MGHGGVDRADSGLALPPAPTPAALSRYLNQVGCCLGQESPARKVGIQTAP